MCLYVGLCGCVYVGVYYRPTYRTETVDIGVMCVNVYACTHSCARCECVYVCVYVCVCCGVLLRRGGRLNFRKAK